MHVPRTVERPAVQRKIRPAGAAAGASGARLARPSRQTEPERLLRGTAGLGDVTQPATMPPEGHIGFVMVNGTTIPHSCAVKTAKPVRKTPPINASHEEALKTGMEEKNRAFVEKGAEVYAKA